MLLARISTRWLEESEQASVATMNVCWRRIGHISPQHHKKNLLKDKKVHKSKGNTIFRC